ncbi:hypothetical protein [Polymorphobacter megasporae]|uniref:hypothetical protein n=1 Tax=Glacieibacterium megasporae TaxID=2835787 RepID=UPI001C1E1D0B|nr:hypothetical protein [Polymorphobacter megasporae]UAJ12411.1 hypothetical protein KTC28_21625 [Polymorphobacter megasporae]
MRNISFAAAMLFAAAASAATSATTKPAKTSAETTGVIAELTGCKALTDNAARLACYDQAAAKLEAATASGEVKVLDREDIRATRRSLFGFDLPKLPFFKGDDSAKDTPEELDAVIRSVQAAPYGKFNLTMEDGAVWASAEPLPRDPKVGAKVHLKKGAIGNYFMTVGSMRSVRATRVR